LGLPPRFDPLRQVQQMKMSLPIVRSLCFVR
jgi:hypothetical protein